MERRDDALAPLITGLCLALAAADGAARARVPEHILARTPDPLAVERVLDADAMCLRDLRRLPAIGPARALAIVRARHDEGLQGGPASWERISGIGPETVRAAGDWLAAARAARLSGRGGGAYTPRGRRP